MMARKPAEIEVVEYSGDKKIADPNALVLDSEVETGPSNKAAPQTSSREKFSWAKDKNLIVVDHQPAIAVYMEDGSFCVRQEDIWGDGNDVIVYFAPEYAQKLADAILALARGSR